MYLTFTVSDRREQGAQGGNGDDHRAAGEEEAEQRLPVSLSRADWCTSGTRSCAATSSSSSTTTATSPGSSSSATGEGLLVAGRMGAMDGVVATVVLLHHVDLPVPHGVPQRRKTFRPLCSPTSDSWRQLGLFWGGYLTTVRKHGFPSLFFGVPWWALERCHANLDVFRLVKGKILAFSTWWIA